MKKVITGCYSGRLLFFLFMILLLGACSTQKNTFVNRTYHTLTTKFNGYFNASASFHEGLTTLEEQHIDNYEEMLSIFKYGTPQQASSIGSYMDAAYEKSSIVIRRHSMNIKGEEYNKYIDDAYFLIARSHFFKRDFNLAVLTFEYIIRLFDTPLAYQSKVWIAKSHMFQERYDQAQKMLDVVAEDITKGSVDQEGKKLYNLVSADLNMRQGKYNEAIPFLKSAIDQVKNKKEKTRFTFILGQLYQEVNDYANAQRTYAGILKMNPDFDLSFQANIRMAMAYDPSSGNSSQIRAKLMDMLEDEKNDDYRDQIYFALGQMSVRQDKKQEAVDLFIKSTEVSQENRLQKGLSFYSLGRIFYEEPDFLKASMYYDSTVTYLPQNFENYQQISQTRLKLSELARNLKIIEHEDSLQVLAAMSPDERNRVVEEIVERIKEEERLAKEAERNRVQTAQAMAQTRRGNQPQDNRWYFYNPSSISFGRTEFISRFGERPLEDLWRLSNKQAIAFDFGMEGDPSQQEGQDSLGGINKTTLLGNIPTTPEMMAASNKRMAQAYYNSALVFRDKFQYHQRAADSFETLVARFPDFENKLYAYYFLFNLYRSLENTQRAEIFRGRIIDEFPESDFAQILKDPDYIKNLCLREERAKNLYRSSYHDFLSGNYQQVIDVANQMDTTDINRELKSQFAYLRALSHGKMDNKAEFHDKLQQVVDYYAGTQVHQPATDLLASLNGQGDSFDNQAARSSDADLDANLPIDESSVFKFNPDAVHFLVWVINVQHVDARNLRRFINDFNKNNFRDRDFSMSNIFLDEKNQLITLTNFINMDLGMEYYRQIMNAEGLKQFQEDAIQAFLISVDNYPVFYQEKNVEEYSDFFRQRYLRN